MVDYPFEMKCEVLKEELATCEAILNNVTSYLDRTYSEDQEDKNKFLVLIECTRGMLASVLECINWQDENSIRLTAFTLWMAQNIGMMRFMDEENAKLGFERELRRELGRRAVNRGRWKAVETTKAQLLLQAENKWATGDLLLHNEMADELLEDNPEAAKIISKAVLLAALRPVAAKYGKVRGVKGIRKEKLPPK